MRWFLLMALCGLCLSHAVPVASSSFKIPGVAIKEKVNTSPENLRNLAEVAAIMHGLPVERFIAQVEAESAFNPNAVSHAGATGIAQIMPSTAKIWKVDPHDPIASLDVMAREMSRYWEEYQRQGHDKKTAYELALAAYNAGPGSVQQYNGIPPYPETQAYIKRILGEGK